MHIHIIGICGTFMGGIALIAKEIGHKVSGSDLNIYPPMSDQLKSADIKVLSGYKKDHLNPSPDLVIVGNSISRGNEIIEHVLDSGLDYISGPQWLAENVLHGKMVLAIAGTHGKTTTSSMLLWILEYSGLSPGFLIGGVPKNFGISARVGNSDYFIIEADEYDTAFFDKRSKFMHYRANVLIINNIEFDHADIFHDLEDVKKQFYHYVRTLPAKALIVKSSDDSNIGDVLKKECWTPVEEFSVSDPNCLWHASNISNDLRKFDIFYSGENLGRVEWNLSGIHNISNCLAATAAANNLGVPIKKTTKALSEFQSVKRRMEFFGSVNGIDIYDDFAHHPTAIQKTLYGLRRLKEKGKILLILDIRSNSMKMGSHINELPFSLKLADFILIKENSGIKWNMDKLFLPMKEKLKISKNATDILSFLKDNVQSGDTIIIMSNGIIEGIHEEILKTLE